MNLIVSPLAQIDSFLTQDRLEQEHPGYGLAFAQELSKAIDEIVVTPRLFSPTEDGPTGIETREFFIARFLQRVIFMIEDDTITILAVVHARRRPGSWTDRLTESN